MMKNTLIILLALVFGIGFCQAQTNIQYQESNEVISNPERGFYHADPSLDFDDLQNMVYQENISIAYYNFALDDFKDTFISSSYLRKMEDDFAKMRKGGIKSVIRFTYTEKATPPYGDAPIDIVLNHISQVKPILQKNADVILAIQAGFIGAWGEWYYTDYYSTTPGNINEEQMEWRRQITHALLDAIPERMIQLRTPFFKRNMVPLDDWTPVSEEEAFKNTAIARIAHHNDCFLASTTDYGTYQDIDVEKAYLEEDSKYTMVGGETCNKNYLSVCENAMLELERFHWTFLNRDYHQGVIGQWIDGGCYNEIEKRLGYRYRLISAEIMDESKPGGSFSCQLKMYNDGFANVMNRRDVKLILRNANTGIEYTCLANTDPRLWPLHDTITVSFEAGLPTQMTNANYQVYLQLPDPYLTLKDRTEYAIRLANENIFEESTAYHSLLHSVNISDQNATDDYEGSLFFGLKDAEIPQDIQIVIDGQVDDWQSIQPIYSSSQNLKKLKTWNTVDSLFLSVEGQNISNNWQIFLNTDGDSQSGFQTEQWVNSGADYLIENGILYAYNGSDNSWDWTDIQVVEFALNNQVLELKVPRKVNGLNMIQDEVSLGIISGFDDLISASFLPAIDFDFVSTEISNLQKAPAFVDVKNVGNKAVVYWAANIPCKGIQAELQRSINSGDWESIYTTLNSYEFSYSDEELETSSTVAYRVRFTDGKNYTAFTSSENIVISGEGDEFVDIMIDGLSEDWMSLQPIIAENQQDRTTLRIFNTEEHFYFSMEGQDIEHYEFFVSDSINDHYKISSDSLFERSNNQWIYKKSAQKAGNNQFVEVGFDMSDLFSTSTTVYYVHATLNHHNLLQGEALYNLKYNSLSRPENFQVLPSIDDPYGTIKLKWRLNASVDGYKLYRSTGDSLHFEEYKNFGPEKFYYLDHDLDSSQVYYYRLFSYQGIVRSPYTNTLWLQPNGISEKDEFETGMKVFPNPMHIQSKIELYSLAPQEVEIRMLTAQGELIKTIYSGIINGQQFVSFQRNEIPKGVYFIQLRGKKKLINQKLIII